MTTLPVIYTIQASDAPQHSGKFEEILQNLKSENRIEGYTTLAVDEDLSSLRDKIKDKDMIFIVLTNRLEPLKTQIEERCKSFKMNQPGARVAEIIVDNIPYENTFIAFPADLRPIRDFEDMDAAWSGIEHNLKELFPVKKIQDPVPGKSTDWPEYLEILKLTGKSIVVFIVLVFASFGVLLIGILGLLSGLTDHSLQNPTPLFLLIFLVSLVVAFFLTKKMYEKQKSS